MVLTAMTAVAEDAQEYLPGIRAIHLIRQLFLISLYHAPYLDPDDNFIDMKNSAGCNRAIALFFGYLLIETLEGKVCKIVRGVMTR